MREFFEGHVRKTGCAAAAAVVAIAVATGSAWAQSEVNEVNDPLESVNRAIFDFNLKIDRAILKPAAKGYRAVLPEPGRDIIKNFLDNLRTPIILANDILQGKPGRAGITVHRFLFNTTLGLGGLFDLVGDLGLEGHDEDFGQTLAVWGVGEGPYLVIPILGPRPPRDAIGLAVDSVVFDPLGYVDLAFYIGLARTGTRAIDERSRHIESLDEIEETSIDFYATIRSLYRQRRNDEIRDGAPPPTIPIPTISLEFDEDEAKEQVSLLPEN
jgi:phospholipid-binding lipoprotein MlaA